MIYAFHIATPANTTEADPLKTQLQLCQGVIHQVDIVFPPGCAGLAHLKILKGVHQAFPTLPATHFAGDDDILSYREHLELSHEPYILDAITWNEDDTYSHTITVRLGILKKKNILRRLF